MTVRRVLQACGASFAAGLLIGAAAPGPEPLAVAGQTDWAPRAFKLFCHRMPQECLPGKGEPSFDATPARLHELEAVNRAVNRRIEAATDFDVYGVSEHWALPATQGDCEDYALLKRHILIEKGWPVGSVLLTVVRDRKGQGHTVLTVRTGREDQILDNTVDELRTWAQTPYLYVWRQSENDPKVWVGLWGVATDTGAGLEDCEGDVSCVMP